jgi:hypothetical protein
MQRRQPGPRRERIIFEMLVQTSLGLEYEHRVQQRQTPDGKLLLEFVLQPSPINLRRLMCALTRRLNWHSLLRNREDVKEEIEAEAGVALENRVSPIRNATDALSERMSAVIDGRLNKIAGNARSAVREKLETVSRRAALNHQLPESEDGTTTIPDLPDPSAQPDLALIADELLQSFSPIERTIIEMRLEGRSHKEISKALHVSRPAISQRLKSIKERYPHSR